MLKRNKAKPIIISPQAKEDINNILLYLSQNWNQSVVDGFLEKIRGFLLYHLNQPKNIWIL
jgi:plasmid stabilization system protein ParE